jgi:hypothetical protein
VLLEVIAKQARSHVLLVKQVLFSQIPKQLFVFHALRARFNLIRGSHFAFLVFLEPFSRMLARLNALIVKQVPIKPLLVN